MYDSATSLIYFDSIISFALDVPLWLNKDAGLRVTDNDGLTDTANAIKVVEPWWFFWALIIGLIIVIVLVLVIVFIIWRKPTR